MPDKNNKEPVERRKHWRDRRNVPDRRNPERIIHSGYDCRTGEPRRQADVSGELTEGDIWWNSDESYLA